MEGYISPGMDISFVVTFHPSKLSRAIQYEGLQCFIQGSEALRLTLAGCCMETPVTKEVTGADTGWVSPLPHHLHRISPAGLFREPPCRATQYGTRSHTPPPRRGRAGRSALGVGKASASSSWGTGMQRAGPRALTGFAGGCSWKVLARAPETEPGATLQPAHGGAVWLQVSSLHKRDFLPGLAIFFLTSLGGGSPLHLVCKRLVPLPPLRTTLFVPKAMVQMEISRMARKSCALCSRAWRGASPSPQEWEGCLGRTKQPLCSSVADADFYL